MNAESIAPNISSAVGTLSVSRSVLCLLTYHDSKMGNDANDDYDPDQHITTRYLNVNDKPLSFLRMTCKSDNLYESFLSDGLKEDDIIPPSGTITVLLTRHENSTVESHDKPVNKMHLHGPDLEIKSNYPSFPIAMPLEKDFVVKRIHEIFGDEELDEGVDMNQAIKCYIDHLSKVPCDASKPDAMWNFIEKKMLPCIQKLQTVTGRDHIGVTNEFWGCQSGGTWDTYPYVFQDPSHRSDPKVLMAFIMENFCRMSGIAAHPINGQSRMMVFRYLSRGVNPYGFFSGNDSGGEAAERCNRFFKSGKDTPTNTLVIHLPVGGVITQDTLDQCKSYSAHLGQISSKAQGHGIFPRLGKVVSLLGEMQQRGKIPFFQDGLDLLFREKGGAVQTVSGWFAAEVSPKTFVELTEEAQDVTTFLNLSQVFAKHWKDAVYEIIRTTLEENAVHFSNNSTTREDVFKKKDDFLEHMIKFTRDKSDIQLFMFCHTEHHKVDHLTSILSNSVGTVEYNSLGNLDSLDYEIIQLLLLALFSKDSFRAVETFCLNTRTVTQMLTRDAADDDRRLISSMVLMISKCTWAYSLYKPMGRKQEKNHSALNCTDIEIYRFMVAAEVFCDAAPALKEMGPLPRLDPNSFLQMFRVNLKIDEFKEFVTFSVVPKDHIKRLMEAMEVQDEAAVKAKFDIEKFTSGLEGLGWKGDLEFLPAVAISYCVYLERYCEYLFTKKGTSKPKESTAFTDELYDRHYEMKPLGDFCNWGDIKSTGFKLQPKEFISSICEYDDNDNLTPYSLLTGLGLSPETNEDLQFSTEPIVESLVRTFLSDSSRRMGRNRFRYKDFYIKTEEIDAKRTFTESAKEFCNAIYDKFDPEHLTSPSTKKRKMKETLDVDENILSEFEKIRLGLKKPNDENELRPVIDELAEAVESFWGTIKNEQHSLDTNTYYDKDSGEWFEESNADAGVDAEVDDASRFLESEAAEANGDEEEE